MTVFKNPNDPDNVMLIATLTNWVRDKVMDEKISIEIVELDCADPGCIDKETKIILSLEGKAVNNYRIHKPLVFVRKLDIDFIFKK